MHYLEFLDDAFAVALGACNGLHSLNLACIFKNILMIFAGIPSINQNYFAK